MLKEERHQLIIELLRQNGKVMATELSKLLSVSEDTIRRDLNDLAEAGKMQRVHGGALPHSPAELPFTDRLQQSPQAKAQIAEAAIHLISAGQTIILDGGTTNLQVARRLQPDLRATIITNSIPIASALGDHPTIEVIILGGRLYKGSYVTIGSSTEEALNRIHADICFLGICSLHPEIGITVSNLEESYTKRAMINASNKVVALASSEKLDTASPYKAAPINALNTLITEKEVSDDILMPYQSQGLEIITAG